MLAGHEGTCYPLARQHGCAFYFRVRWRLARHSQRSATRRGGCCSKIVPTRSSESAEAPPLSHRGAVRYGVNDFMHWSLTCGVERGDTRFDFGRSKKRSSRRSGCCSGPASHLEVPPVTVGSNQPRRRSVACGLLSSSARKATSSTGADGESAPGWPHPPSS